MKKKHKNIPINWNISAQSFKSDFHWPVDIIFKSLEKDFEIEKKLNWPKYTLEAIRYAFLNNLSRFHRWNIKEESDYKEAITTAAKFYKRGVFDKKKSKGSYEIIFSDDFFNNYQDDLVIIDKNVFDNYSFLKDINNKFILKPDEKTKNISTVSQIISFYKNLNIKPQKIFALGGGIIGDISGFAACILSIKIIFIPTTILAMVDACIGGKTGVNFPPYGKNQIGCFYFPDQVIITPKWLNTLPKRQIFSGASEAIKHGFIKYDLNLIDKIIYYLKKIDKSDINSFIFDIIKIKSDIITQDSTENNIRIFLNLGHTLGHALEEVSDNNILHGEAVAIGLLFMLVISKNTCNLPKSNFDILLKKLKSADILLDINSLSNMIKYDLKSEDFWNKILFYLKHDKKMENDINWVIMKNPVYDPHVFKSTIDNNYLFPSWLESLVYLDFKNQ